LVRWASRGWAASSGRRVIGLPSWETWSVPVSVPGWSFWARSCKDYPERMARDVLIGFAIAMTLGVVLSALSLSMNWSGQAYHGGVLLITGIGVMVTLLLQERRLSKHR